jgi:hypothetical protein
VLAGLLILTLLLLHAVSYRPDIATWLSDATLRNLFNEAVSEPDYSAVLAGLLLLPEGWLAPQLLGQESRDPRAWLGRFVDSVMQVGGGRCRSQRERGFEPKAPNVLTSQVSPVQVACGAFPCGGLRPR